ncbi:cell wall protein DAN4-like [Scomber scombrus]|uniref:Cell wall protein DAN4-like n=1 Tax=Scomber scombrus TaxID=13677 RepID=A0AAV1PFA7_SCOSC
MMLIHSQNVGFAKVFLANLVCGNKRLTSVQCFSQQDFLGIEQLLSTPKTAFFVPMEITNRVFTPALQNPASEEYHSLYKEVSALLNGIYACYDIYNCPENMFYGGVAGMTFRSGSQPSVIANATVVFDTTKISSGTLYVYFFVKSNIIKPHTLQINLEYTTKSVLLYGSECWSLKPTLQKSLDGCYTRMLHAVLNISKSTHLTNSILYEGIPRSMKMICSNSVIFSLIQTQLLQPDDLRSGSQDSVIADATVVFDTTKISSGTLYVYCIYISQFLLDCR